MSEIIYTNISKDLEERILSDRKNMWQNPYKCENKSALRRNKSHDRTTLFRTPFIRDTETILHLPYYNRYADKTQVFSFYHNDDITRRALHVQLVSRIARNIGQVLDLNLDLIEAISLGHDIGHTPFGHAGERFLNEILYSKTGKYFNHNVHSVRVLDKVFKRNLSLQTLDGILCHNGEFEMKELHPKKLSSFSEFDSIYESCYTDGIYGTDNLIPATLEGCLVRLCDIIAYLGKDRQDAITAHIIDQDYKFESNIIGIYNAAIINNLTVDIIENSYGKDYIALSKDVFNDLKMAKKENYSVIYDDKNANERYNNIIKPMFYDMFEKLLSDLVKNDTSSVIHKHHVKFVSETTRFYDKTFDYTKDDKLNIVVDYIASMTDDYFITLYKELFPDSKHKIEYQSYFE